MLHPAGFPNLVQALRADGLLHQCVRPLELVQVEGPEDACTLSLTYAVDGHCYGVEELRVPKRCRRRGRRQRR